MVVHCIVAQDVPTNGGAPLQASHTMPTHVDYHEYTKQ